MYPRWLVTLDEYLEPLPVSVRVGQVSYSHINYKEKLFEFYLSNFLKSFKKTKIGNLCYLYILLLMFIKTKMITYYYMYAKVINVCIIVITVMNIDYNSRGEGGI